MTGEQLYDEYRQRHGTDAPPTWSRLGELKRRAWCAWAEAGGHCQTGIRFTRRPTFTELWRETR